MTLLGYRVDLTAPLPLGVERATQHALELRANTSISYPVLAVIMRIYHGIDRTDGWWAHRLKAAGAEPRPHGNPFPHAIAQNRITPPDPNAQKPITPPDQEPT